MFATLLQKKNNNPQVQFLSRFIWAKLNISDQTRETGQGLECLRTVWEEVSHSFTSQTGLHCRIRTVDQHCSMDREKVTTTGGFDVTLWGSDRNIFHIWEYLTQTEGQGRMASSLSCACVLCITTENITNPFPFKLVLADFYQSL